MLESLEQFFPNCVPRKFYVVTITYTFHLNIGFVSKYVCRTQIQNVLVCRIIKKFEKRCTIGFWMPMSFNDWGTPVVPVKKDGDDPAEKFRKIADSLSVCHGCLLYGARVVIPTKLRRQVLDLLHECHFGIQRMKQLARTAVYWTKIDSNILYLCQQYSTCAGHQSEPSSGRPPLDATGEAVEPLTYRSCHKLSGFQLACGY